MAGALGHARDPRDSVEMVRNPDFSFPPRRPASVHTHAPPVLRPSIVLSHTRAASALPNFTFNASDASGLCDDVSELNSDAVAPSTPSHRGHRRNGSEFVGGDSRQGLGHSISSSPLKRPAAVSSLSAPLLSGRGHAHRRSAALDGGDMIVVPLIGNRKSVSLPSSPVVPPPGGPDTDTQPEPPVSPPTRARVGFSENVEYIPRPLSITSSDTGSSFSSPRHHSVSNSISSVLSLNTSSSPAARVPPALLSEASAVSVPLRSPRAHLSRRLSDPDTEKARSPPTTRELSTYPQSNRTYRTNVGKRNATQAGGSSFHGAANQDPFGPTPNRHSYTPCTTSAATGASVFDEDEKCYMIDLDWAVCPAELAEHRPRRELHSSRLNCDFSGPGQHFQPRLHRRSESAPALPMTSFRGISSQCSLADVFEGEDEEEEEQEQEETAPVLVQVVEAHEEPPTSTATKSSRSSGTSTVSGVPIECVAPLPSTPETCSSPWPSPPTRRTSSSEALRLCTPASSVANQSTASSACDGHRSSVEVPSLSSTLSTMTNTTHVNASRRDVSGDSSQERRRKRSSIQSLSQLMGGSFGVRPKSDKQVTGDALGASQSAREHGLKKLMFWRSKSKQSLRSM